MPSGILYRPTVEKLRIFLRDHIVILRIQKLRTVQQVLWNMTKTAHEPKRPTRVSKTTPNLVKKAHGIVALCFSLDLIWGPF